MQRCNSLMRCRLNPNIFCYNQVKKGSGLWMYLTSCKDCYITKRVGQTRLDRIGENTMPLQKAEPFTRFPAISMKAWKPKESKTLYFMDEDKDVSTPNGVMFLMHVKEDNATKELWVKDKTALAIGIAPFVPLKGKTLKVTKSGSGLKDTRYTAEELKVKA